MGQDLIDAAAQHDVTTQQHRHHFRITDDAHAATFAPNPTARRGAERPQECAQRHIARRQRLAQNHQADGEGGSPFNRNQLLTFRPKSVINLPDLRIGQVDCPCSRHETSLYARPNWRNNAAPVTVLPVGGYGPL